MTNAQLKKLDSIKNVLNHYENSGGDLVIETNYGSKYYCRLFIGVRGGFCSSTIVYRHYDFEDKIPYHELFTTYI